MYRLIVALVLISAFLHASWNALLRIEPDKDRSLVAAVGVAALLAAVIATVRWTLGELPFATPAAAGWAAIAGILEWTYFVSLARALGPEIRVNGPTPLTGRLVHVEPETTRLPDGSTRTRARVAVLTGKGLQQFVLDDADSIAFTDPVLQNQVTEALRRIAAYRDTGRRTLTLTVHGKGQRTVRVGYVVAMPVWKTSYRLSLPADPHAATAPRTRIANPHSMREKSRKVSRPTSSAAGRVRLGALNLTGVAMKEMPIKTPSHKVGNRMAISFRMMLCTEGTPRSRHKAPLAPGAGASFRSSRAG